MGDAMGLGEYLEELREAREQIRWARVHATDAEEDVPDTALEDGEELRVLCALLEHAEHLADALTKRAELRAIVEGAD